MYRVGLSTKGKVIDEALFKAYSDAGIFDMEISPDGHQYDSLDYQKMFSWSKQYGVNLWSFHLPFYPFERVDISSHDSQLRENTVLYLSELIRKAADIEIDKFIIHPSSEPIPDGERKIRLDYAKECLSKLADVAESCGAQIAVEDLPRSCLGNNSDEIVYLVSDDDRLKVCFDTNHLLSEDPTNFVRRLGDKIITMHVSDYDFLDEKHWMPGEGKLDWNALLSVMKEINYSGSWLYEIPFDCPDTIVRDRDLCCDDFVKNANELFAGKELTVLGRTV